MTYWNRERTIMLIEAYKSQNLLWNPNNPANHDLSARKDAWTAISNEMEVGVLEVKSKLSGLKTVFKSQHRNGVTPKRWWTTHLEFLHNIVNAPEGANDEVINLTEDSEISDDQDSIISVSSGSSDPVTTAVSEPVADVEGPKEPVDEWTLYMRFLEQKVRNYPSETRNNVQLEINVVLYGADNDLLDRSSE